MAIEVECAYCDRRGTYPGDIEIRHGKFACIDTEACDIRDARLHAAAEEEEES